MAEIDDELKSVPDSDTPDHFAQTGADYAKYRPGYSERVFDDLLNEVPGRDVAVDCGCGTGQITGALSSRFEKVYGVDVSKDQLAHAIQASNVQYLNQGAEDLKFLPDGSVDLITAGTAYHWFDADKFWAEARRVLKPKGVVTILQIKTPEIKEAPGLFGDFMSRELHPHIPPTKASNSKLSEQVPAGFESVALPNSYGNDLRMRVSDVVGWPKTTSAYGPYVEKTGTDPSSKFLAAFEAKGFGADSEVTFDNTASVLTFRKKEAEPDSIRLIEAKPEDVSDQDLRALIENLLSFTYLPNGGYPLKDHIEGNIGTVKRAFATGHVFAAKDGDKTAAIVTALSKEKMPDGRPLYDLTKGSVLPEYRNQKLLSKLVKQAIEMIRSKYPNSPIVTSTANDKAIGMYRRLGWKEATWGDGSDLDLLVAGEKPDGSAKTGGPEWKKEFEAMVEKGYKIFIFDPKDK